MKNTITLLTFLLITATVSAQKSLSEIKVYEELTKEELFQIGELAAINSYNDKAPNIILGFFFGSIAIDLVSSTNKINQNKYKRWTKKLDFDDRIISDFWFADGFITKRKEQIIESFRTGRVAARVAATIAVISFVPDILDAEDLD